MRDAIHAGPVLIHSNEINITVEDGKLKAMVSEQTK